jgi:CLN3 protein
LVAKGYDGILSFGPSGKWSFVVTQLEKTNIDVSKIALPTMVVTTGANVMFTGITGVYGICLSTTAAITSFGTPLFAHLMSYNLRVIACIVASILSFVICTLGNSQAGPAIGTIFAGFVYAFGTNTFLAVAAFYRQQTVIAFSIGSGKWVGLLVMEACTSG